MSATDGVRDSRWFQAEPVVCGRCQRQATRLEMMVAQERLLGVMCPSCGFIEETATPAAED